MVAVMAGRQDGRQDGAKRLRHVRRGLLQSEARSTCDFPLWAQKAKRGKPPILRFRDSPEFRQRSSSTGLARCAQRRVGLLLQHHITDGQRKPAKHHKCEVERDIRFMGMVRRLGRTDQADVGLAER